MLPHPIRRRHTTPILAGLLSIAVVRIILTYPVFCQTYDEPFHIARGMQWWGDGSYDYVHHPPLAPAVFAIGLLLDGAEHPNTGSKLGDGNAVLYDTGTYQRTLSIARAGNLPFLLMASFAVWLWARRISAPQTSLVSVLVFTTLPSVLGHAGLATTDLAASATLAISVYCFSTWLEEPTPLRTVAFGLATGVALLSKFSTLVFLPFTLLSVCLAYYWLGYRLKDKPFSWKWRILTALLSAWISLLVVWAGYQASIGPTGQSLREILGTMGFDIEAPSAVDRCSQLPFPAPEFIHGIASVARQQSGGHRLPMYFLGQTQHGDGWLLFFPTLLLAKTPVPCMFLSFLGGIYLCRAALTNRNGWQLSATLVPLSMLVVVLPANINIGMRHILPIYLFISPLAAYGAAELYGRSPVRFWRAFTIVILGWHVFQGVLVHPDYLAYFNELTGAHPEQIAVDSDLDWGQDLNRLAHELRRRNIHEFSLAYFGTADLRHHDLPPFDYLPPYQPCAGWVAVSLYHLQTNPGYKWLEQHEAATTAGRSIRLYFVNHSDKQSASRASLPRSERARRIPPPTQAHDPEAGASGSATGRPTGDD